MREAKEQRAFNSRRPAILTVRCPHPKCREILAEVAPSDEGLVLVAASYMAPTHSHDKRRRVRALKDEGRADLAKSIAGFREVTITMLDEPVPRSVRCHCSRSWYSLDFDELRSVITEGGNIRLHRDPSR